MMPHFGKGPRDGAAQMTAVLQTVRGYWEGLRRAGAIPARSDVDPRGMADSLDRVFLVERIAPGHARFRLAGMHLTELMGMEVRGMPLTALFEPVARQRLSDELEQVFAGPAVLDIRLEAERGIGRGALAGRMLLMPLRGDQGEPALALGCLATEGMVGRVPRRFAVAGMVREMIQPASPVLRVVEPVSPVQPVPPTQVVQPRPWLRLVSSLD